MSSENDGNANGNGEERDPAHSAGRAPASAGAKSSITAPANSIRVLRRGIDSLYVSYPGTLDRDAAIALQEAKELAQGSTEELVARAGFCIGDHTFTVLPRGRGRFAYVVEDNWFSIQLANAASMPMAYVQIRSEYLTAVGPEEAIRTLNEIVFEFGDCADMPHISRVDLFADFVGDHDLPTQPGFAWLKRCRKRDIHEEANRITGVSFGPGNELSARLYDKTFEITKSGKDYLKPLWAAQGWQEGETVWRMEFQTRREGLPDALKGQAFSALPHLGAWWRYLATEWLRLAIPSDSDETRTRWPTHPVWQAIADAWDVPPNAPLMTRVTKDRAPTDDLIFKNGLWGLSSFMAREGITDIGEGLGEFLNALSRYFDKIPASGGLPGYVERKVRAKARRYNTKVRDDDDEG
jgi:hypothetical protein